MLTASTQKAFLLLIPAAVYRRPFCVYWYDSQTAAVYEFRVLRLYLVLL